jgi:hypothetical protein
VSADALRPDASADGLIDGSPGDSAGQDGDPTPIGKRAARTLIIERVARQVDGGSEESLTFSSGVNVLVGPPNAGKTKWLAFVDFLLGDTGSPEDALGNELAEKYSAASLTLGVFDAGRPNAGATDAASLETSEQGAAGVKRSTSTSGPVDQEAGHAQRQISGDGTEGVGTDEGTVQRTKTTLVIERRWKQPGARGKLFVNGQAMSAEEFSQFLLAELRIPAIHFPRGDPYSPRAWPVLSWRMLLRHLYRQERFWSDLADKQPEAEQHACIAQFLGIAEALFSTQLGALVEKRKRIVSLEARKDAYMDLLHQVTTDIGRFAELSVAVTAESVTSARTRLEEERKGLSDARLGVLRTLAERVESERDEAARKTESTWETYSGQLATQRSAAESLAAEAARIDARAEELRAYHSNVSAELQRLERAQSAGEALSQLKVTHCPVCDQSVNPSRGSLTECYLCYQPYDRSGESGALGSKRVAFEVEQLREEARELGEMLERLGSERARVEGAGRAAREEAARLDTLLRPTRAAAAAILPPELSLYDQEVGRVEEQLRTLERINKSLDQRDSLSGDIDAIAAEVQALEAEVNRLTESVRYEAVNDVLAEGFNSYFNALNTDDPNRWPEAAVRVRVRPRTFEITLGDAAWSPMLGATFKCFFLNAYHYALMGLTGRDGFTYPGFAILDFPPTLADGNDLTDEENYLVAPFVGLLGRLPATAQLIVAGRAFVDLVGANRLELSEVWR